jgi:ribosome-associated protein
LTVSRRARRAYTQDRARPIQAQHGRCPIATTTTTTTTQRTTGQSERADAARAFAIEAARLAANTRCNNVVILDVRGLSPVTDYFILATGTSPRQMRTVIDEVSELGEQRNFEPFMTSGYEGEQWILVDFFDVVVHVFNQESRQFYDLDNLWGDARTVEWQQSEQRAPS